VIVLANPPGWPFVGNDFYRECGDCFATHAVGNVSAESQAQLLKEIAPDIPVQMVATLLSIFGQLRLLHEEGRIAYPYSVRELVLIARRLQQFGRGGLSAALRDVFDGDSEDRAAAAAIADVVDAHGLESLARAVRQGVPSSSSQQAGALDLKLSQPSTRLGRQLGSEHTPPAMPEDGPKHGEWDGQQHMGGNRFAGGSGGTGTAGLGGRAGPYRLDVGQEVHMLTEAEKAAGVSQESIDAAQRMADEAYTVRKQLLLSSFNFPDVCPKPVLANHRFTSSESETQPNTHFSRHD
jgi:hypothetical protein